MNRAARHIAACAKLPPHPGGVLRCALGLALLVGPIAADTPIARGDDIPVTSMDGAPIEQIADKLLVTTVTVRIAKVPQTAPPASTTLGKREEPNAAPQPNAASAPAPAAAEKPTPPPAVAAPPGNAAPAADKTQAPAGHVPVGIVQRLPVRMTAQTAAALRQSLAAHISVGTGVSLGNGLVVTFWRSKDPCQFRVTLPDGEQAEAKLIVHDQYSGLCLLQTNAKSLPALELSQRIPAIGAWLMTAASSGIDRPLVSQGIVGGVDRIPRATNLPPLLQCDLRTTSTSCGAPVVDRQGNLVGIVAAVSDVPTTEGDAEAGWTFVVPAKYIARLLAARLDQETVILQRQRPALGLTLMPNQDGTVRVESIVPEGPAEAAGIRAGELILEADGRKIRSPYQVMSLVFRKQPGEMIEFAVRSADGTIRRLVVTLSTALPGEADITAGTLLEPRAAMMRSAISKIVISRQGQAAKAGAIPAAPTTDAAPVGNRLLSEQLAAFEQAIAQLRAQLKERDGKLAETDREIGRLTAEIERLKGQGEKKK